MEMCVCVCVCWFVYIRKGWMSSVIVLLINEYWASAYIPYHIDEDIEEGWWTKNSVNANNDKYKNSPRKKKSENCRKHIQYANEYCGEQLTAQAIIIIKYYGGFIANKRLATSYWTYIMRRNDSSLCWLVSFFTFNLLTLVYVAFIHGKT